MVYYIVYEQVIIILVTTITNSVWLIQHMWPARSFYVL